MSWKEATKMELKEEFVMLPEQLPAVEYGPDDATRKVSAKGIISFRGQTFRVAVRAIANTNEHKIYFCNQHIRTIILN